MHGFPPIMEDGQRLEGFLDGFVVELTAAWQEAFSEMGVEVHQTPGHLRFLLKIEEEVEFSQDAQGTSDFDSRGGR